MKTTKLAGLLGAAVLGGMLISSSASAVGVFIPVHAPFKFMCGVSGVKLANWSGMPIVFNSPVGGPLMPRYTAAFSSNVTGLDFVVQTKFGNKRFICNCPAGQLTPVPNMPGPYCYPL